MSERQRYTPQMILEAIRALIVFGLYRTDTERSQSAKSNGMEIIVPRTPAPASEIQYTKTPKGRDTRRRMLRTHPSGKRSRS